MVFNCQLSTDTSLDVRNIGRNYTSKSIRYSGALHALGGYLVEDAISDGGAGMATDELLSEHVGPYEGPLIHHDNEAWQNEIGTV